MSKKPQISLELAPTPEQVTLLKANMLWCSNLYDHVMGDLMANRKHSKRKIERCDYSYVTMVREENTEAANTDPQAMTHSVSAAYGMYNRYVKDLARGRKNFPSLMDGSAHYVGLVFDDVAQTVSGSGVRIGTLGWLDTAANTDTPAIFSQLSNNILRKVVVRRVVVRDDPAEDLAILWIADLYFKAKVLEPATAEQRTDAEDAEALEARLGDTTDDDEDFDFGECDFDEDDDTDATPQTFDTISISTQTELGFEEVPPPTTLVTLELPTPVWQAFKDAADACDVPLATWLKVTLANIAK